MEKMLKCRTFLKNHTTQSIAKRSPFSAHPRALPRAGAQQRGSLDAMQIYRIASFGKIGSALNT